MLWELFLTFFKIGFMSFGGGYAMIPVIQHETAAHHWLYRRAIHEFCCLGRNGTGPDCNEHCYINWL
ncbi:chromate transporter [Paenibacillus sp. Root444D2]|uniref:chromate transporter n=1 Tax=Paenibacillus sp. Root444D2 TaxID=1736538 RepID=UPI002E0D1E73